MRELIMGLREQNLSLKSQISNPNEIIKLKIDNAKLKNENKELLNSMVRLDERVKDLE
jgi:hypothetical protein